MESEPLPTGADARRLFLLGLLGLFLELTLIRYLAGNIWNLGYFPNLVLIAVFTGMGIGFVFHERVADRHSPWAFHGALGLLVVLAAFVTFCSPAIPGFGKAGGEVAGELFFTATSAESRSIDFLYFVFWFFSVVAIFALIAQQTAKKFRLFEPLRAYSLDIGGSCVGIVAFMAISWLQLPAWSWFVLLVPVVVGAMPAQARVWQAIPVACLLCVAGLAWWQDQTLLSDPDRSTDVDVIWSPYQKVEYARVDPGHGLPHAQQLFVNGVLHQHILPLEALVSLYYNLPHLHRAANGKPAYERILVIGAGTGNDVAAALHFGAKAIDAIEIDPTIARFGSATHPARPYDDPRVNLVVDDARAFMTRTPERYDLIIFALTDSLVKVSAMSQLRLENYVFTEESIAKAFGLLLDGGDLLFYNAYRHEWLVNKLRQTILNATGRSPMVLNRSGDFWALLVGRDTSGPPLADSVGTIDTPTDDWPFLYLQRRGVPALYRGAMIGLAAFIGLLLLVLQVTTSREVGPGKAELKIAFVLMGTAFLLLETKGVIQFSLLFGTTWANNSLVFLAALLLVLAANRVATRVTHPRALPITFAALLAACAITLVIPLSSLLHVESVLLRFVLASAMTFSPIFFANLLFSITFRDQPIAAHLLGWNLLGTTLGGVVEYASMSTGYQQLTLVVALCYAIAFAFIVASRRRGAAARG